MDDERYLKLLSMLEEFILIQRITNPQWSWEAVSGLDKLLGRVKAELYKGSKT